MRRRTTLPQIPTGEGLRVLVLSASCGQGHMSAARALEIEARRQGLPVLNVDSLDYSPRGYRAWYRGGYELLVKRGPKFWGTLYRTSDDPKLAFKAQTVLDLLFQRRLKALVTAFKPDWVLCAHSLPQPYLDKLRRQGMKFQMAVVVTDLYPHRMWIRGRPDWFFVAGEWSKEILEQKYPFTAGHVDVTGIPIDPVFAREQAALDARKEIGLACTGKLALLSSGGIGGGPVVDAVEALARVDQELDVLVLCGRNAKTKALVDDCVASLGNSRVRFHTRSLIPQPEMAAAMRGSDFIIGKPGGLTTSEALASGCPFVVYLPFLIPGQEEGNADFLASTGAGVIVEAPIELTSVVSSLLTDSSRLAKMSDVSRSLGCPQASQSIIDKLRSL